MSASVMSALVVKVAARVETTKHAKDTKRRHGTLAAKKHKERKENGANSFFEVFAFFAAEDQPCASVLLSRKVSSGRANFPEAPKRGWSQPQRLRPFERVWIGPSRLSVRTCCG
jgi:hypothetical protein